MPNPVTTADYWVSPQRVAAYFDVTDRTVVNWCRDGQVRARKIGPRMWRVHSSVLTDGTD